MVLKTNINKNPIITDAEATSYFQKKAKYYLYNEFKTKAKELKIWSDYLRENFNINSLTELCINIISTTLINSIDNKYIIDVAAKAPDSKTKNLYISVYKLMNSGSLDIRKTNLLNNAFKYALIKL